jgi:hypothetical protein
MCAAAWTTSPTLDTDATSLTNYQHNSETLKTVLNLPPNTPMEYKCHDDSIRDNSSFRNTDIYR